MFTRYRTSFPAFRASRIFASLRVFRCLETTDKLRLNESATCETVCSSAALARLAKIDTRFASASALNKVGLKMAEISWQQGISEIFGGEDFVCMIVQICNSGSVCQGKRCFFVQAAQQGLLAKEQFAVAQWNPHIKEQTINEP